MEKLQNVFKFKYHKNPTKEYFQQLIQLEAFNIICSQKNKFVIVV